MQCSSVSVQYSKVQGIIVQFSISISAVQLSTRQYERTNAAVTDGTISRLQTNITEGTQMCTTQDIHRCTQHRIYTDVNNTGYTQM